MTDPPPDPSTSRSPPLSGTIADALTPELELLRPLGRGSTGQVYLARERPLNRMVAVKVLSKQLAGDAVARARFEREASAAASLDHPNTVTLHRFGYTSDGVPYLVMQYVAGVTLADRLAAEGPLPVAEVRRILGDVAAALSAAHRNGFVHRDIRPANVLCERDSGSVLVTDFGLAGLLEGQGSGKSRLTRTGEVLGEWRHVSPEQLRGEPATESADVYALGVMGYELLTGAGPYQATSDAEFVTTYLHAPQNLTALTADVDPELADLLRRCLTRDPRQRPDAGHLARRLRRSDSGARASSEGAGLDFVDDLLRRRLPQVVAVTLVAGYAALGFIDQLVDRGVVPGVVYRMSLGTFAYSVVASAVISWFHGRRGRQRVSRLEVVLLALVAGAWVITCGLILLL